MLPRVPPAKKYARFNAGCIFSICCLLPQAIYSTKSARQGIMKGMFPGENYNKFDAKPEYLRQSINVLRADSFDNILTVIHGRRLCGRFPQKMFTSCGKPRLKHLRPPSKACESRLLNFGSLYINHWNYRYLGDRERQKWLRHLKYSKNYPRFQQDEKQTCFFRLILLIKSPAYSESTQA